MLVQRKLINPSGIVPSADLRGRPHVNLPLYLRRPKRLSVGVTVTLSLIVMGVAACSGTSASPVPTTTTTAKPETLPVLHAPYRVGSESLTLVDHSRGTPAHGNAPATPFRILSTYVLYPAMGAPTAYPVANAAPASAGKPFALIVFAHGLDSNGPIYQPLLEQWAAAGFVVVAPTFPLSSITAPGGASTVDDIAQPGDLTFVLTKVLDLSQAKGNLLSGMIDPRRIAAAGHSLGAMTVLAWTEDTCCENSRVDAAVIIDGVEADFGKGTFFGGRTVPILVLHGTADQTIPYVNGKKIYDDAKAPRFLVSLIGAPHVSFLQIGTPGQKPPIWEHVDVQSVIDFLQVELDHDNSALKQLSVVANEPGVASLQQET
jgi:predicted dienelactone hydrolase